MGTITISYSGAPGGKKLDVSASGTISDDDAESVIAWAMQSPPPPELSSGKTNTTPEQAFASIADVVVKNFVNTVTRWKQNVAVRAAVADVMSKTRAVVITKL